MIWLAVLCWNPDAILVDVVPQVAFVYPPSHQDHPGGHLGHTGGGCVDAGSHFTRENLGFGAISNAQRSPWHSSSTAICNHCLANHFKTAERERERDLGNQQHGCSDSVIMYCCGNLLLWLCIGGWCIVVIISFCAYVLLGDVLLWLIIYNLLCIYIYCWGVYCCYYVLLWLCIVVVMRCCDYVLLWWCVVVTCPLSVSRSLVF